MHRGILFTTSALFIEGMLLLVGRDLGVIQSIVIQERRLALAGVNHKCLEAVLSAILKLKTSGILRIISA